MIFEDNVSPVRVDFVQPRSLSTRLDALFHRVTSKGNYIPEIDGLRFVAIASVIAFHLYVQLVRYYHLRLPRFEATLLGNGEHGVRLFFVISGFILGLPFASHWLCAAPAPNLKHYFLRRVTRLEPPYFINLIICAALLVIVNHVALASVLPHLAASLFYSHNSFYGDLSTINPVAWSLEVEIQFYILMPLMAFVFTLRNKWGRRILLVTAMVISAVAQEHWATTVRSHLLITYYIQFFLAGFLLADLHLTRGASGKKWSWDALSMLGWPAVFLLSGTTAQLVLPFIVVVLYWAAFHGRVMNYIFRVPVITAIGGMCYTIYLFHFLVIAFATRLIGHSAPPLLLVAVSLILIAIVCPTYFLLVERPCMDREWPRKLGAIIGLVRKRQPSPLYLPNERFREPAPAK